MQPASTIGSREHYVAVGPDRDTEPVRVFGCFTAELRRMAEWLKQCGVRTVVMQSTGVYWIPVFEVLEEAGFDVWLANAQQTQNLPGRQSDVQESQWLLKLHTYGLLGKSFRPTPEIRALRCCWGERNEYVQQAGAGRSHTANPDSCGWTRFIKATGRKKRESITSMPWMR
jgi:transposase